MKEAAGILRQETTILNSKEVQKLLGQKKPTLLHITREFVNTYLNNDLEKLTLLNNSIATHDTALKTLCDAYGELAGFYYYGLLVSRMNKSASKKVNCKRKGGKMMGMS